MDTPRPSLNHRAIEAFCIRHQIKRLALYGSVLRDDFRPESDVDVLVVFEAGARTGLSFFDMQDELTEVMGHRVDLNTPGFINPDFRDQVLSEAKDVYVQG